MDQRAIGSRGGGLGSNHRCRRHDRADRRASTQDAIVVKAGGIDLLDLMKEGLLQPRRIVNLRGIPGLDRIVEEKDGTVRIGAMVTLAHLASHPVIRQRYAALANVARNRRARRSATWRRSAATCCSGRAAGISAPRITIARARAARSASRSPARTSTTPSSITRAARSCIHQRPPPRSSRWAPASSSSQRKVAACGSAGRLLPAPGHGHHPRKRSQAGRDPYRRRAAEGGAGRSVSTFEARRKGFFDWPIADVAVLVDRDPDGICRKGLDRLGAAAPVPHRAKAAEAS